MDSSFQYNATRDTDFAKLSHTIWTDIRKISQNVSSMEKFINQLGTSQETPQIKKQFHDLQHYTKLFTDDTADNLVSLSKIPNPPTQSESKQWKLKRENLSEEFTTVLTKFQLAQRRAVEREKESLHRARANSGYGIDIDDPPGGRTNLIELQGNRQQQLQQMEDEANLQILEEQERGIRQLEENIQDVNETFKKLGSLVHDQGEMVDSIEAHVEMGLSQVSEASQQLRMASSYQNKSRKKKFCLIATAIIVLTVLILIIVLTNR